MKKFLLVFFLFLISSGLFAKKVKFSVDLDTVTVNINGVHITGDFQDEAGFPADWDPATTQMIPEVSDPSIYSIVLDIPAFRKYEFKFVNGIFGYEVEFVPSESRVGYLFNDNRWIYLDSLSNDTQIVAPVIYSMNAPAGKHLLRFRVDMRNTAPISPFGVHAAGNFQGWDTTATYMYTFDGDIHEYIAYVDTGIPAFQHEFKYFNGESAGTQESVPLACSNVNTNRGVFITSDSVLEAVCFSQCSPCAGNALSENEYSTSVIVFPNPSKGEFRVESLKFKVGAIKVFDVLGNLVLENPAGNRSEPLLLTKSGIYFVRIDCNGQLSTSKLIVE